GVETASTTCPAGIDAGMACTVALQFRPTAVGPRNASLSLAASSGSQIVPLTGQAFTTAVQLVPNTVMFGPVEAGHTATATVQLVSHAAVDVSLDSIAATGGGFARGLTTCGATLAAGASCDVVVEFTPPALGDRSGALTIDSGTTSYVANL